MTALAWLLGCLGLLITPPQVARVLDGDTFALYAVGISTEEHVRVLGIDTPELKDSLVQPAREARTFTRQWLTRGSFTVYTCRRDSFGRLLAVVSRGGDTLAVALAHAHLAK